MKRRIALEHVLIDAAVATDDVVGGLLRGGVVEARSPGLARPAAAMQDDRVGTESARTPRPEVLDGTADEGGRHGRRHPMALRSPRSPASKGGTPVAGFAPGAPAAPGVAVFACRSARCASSFVARTERSWSSRPRTVYQNGAPMLRSNAVSSIPGTDRQV